MKARLNFPILGLLCLFFQNIAAQNTPMFEMLIYFEDAVGNKDTIMVGYDPNADSYDLNPQFGESWVNEPFDSTFEVRVVHFDDWLHRTSKKVIGGFEATGGGDTCGAGGNVKILLNAIHFPITIRYDTSLIHAEGCHRNMILSPDWQIFLQQYWWDADVWYCMSNYDEIIDSSDYMIHPDEHAGYLKYEFEVEGQGMKELAGYFWVVKWIGICETLIGTKEGEKSRAGKIFPNPATNEVSLELPAEGGAERIDFYDSAGRKMKSLDARGLFDTDKIQVGDLPAGFYIVYATVSGGNDRLAFKFVKQ